MGATLFVLITSFIAVNAYGSSTYENEDLGIRFEYPPSWKVSMLDFTKEADCSGTELSFLPCSVFFIPNASRSVLGDDVLFGISKDVWRQECNCENLTDYLRYSHEQFVEMADESDTISDFQFVSDNQTTIGKNNTDAWQIQYLEMSINATDNSSHNVTSLYWIAKVDDSFYRFNFESNTGQNFTRYYPDARSMLNSIEFVSNLTPLDRVPSFMLGTNNSLVETDYEDQSEETVKIHGMNSFIQPNSIVNGIFTVVGEVQNIGDTSLTFVRPAITLYDSSNDVIGTDTTFTEPSSISPGGSTSFKFTIIGNSILGGVNAVESYKVIVSGR